jgi:hypothetical protein
MNKKVNSGIPIVCSIIKERYHSNRGIYVKECAKLSHNIFEVNFIHDTILAILSNL